MARRTISFTRQPRGRPLPASLVQQSLWDFEQVLAGEPVFHLPMTAFVQGPLDAGALEQAITALVARHETLRTTFAGAGGELHQVIAEPGPVALAVDDASAGRPAAEAMASQHVRARFDLASAPPLRPHLYRVAAGDHLVSLDFHHIAVDGWSLGLLWNELWSGYAALRAGRALVFAQKPFDYADFSAWYHADAPQLRDELGFWRRLIGDGIPVLELPVDRPRSATTRYAGSRRDLPIPGAQARALIELALGHGATAWMAYLAAFEAMLWRVTGQTDFGIGTPVSMLSRERRQGMVGPFLNLLPMRADVSGAPSYLDLLARVRRSAFDAWRHRYVPWLWLLELSGPCPAGVSPHFQVMYNFQTPEPGTATGPTELQMAPAAIEVGAVEFDLGFTIFESEGGTVGSLEYKTHLFEPATIDRLLEELAAVLAAALADPRQPLG